VIRGLWPLSSAGRSRADEGLGTVDECLGHIGQTAVAGPGVVAQQRERLGHVQAETLSQLALSLLDDDPAVQRGLQLLIERVTLPRAALVQQADGGDVCQRLADALAGSNTPGSARNRLSAPMT
jgi:hypothetical protein